MPKKTRRTNGEGCLYYDKQKKLWTYRITIYDKVTQKSTIKSISAKTQKLAKDKFDKLMYDTENKQYLEEHSIPLIYLIKHNLEKKYNSNIISDGAYMRSSFSIKAIENSELGKMLVDEISSDDIQDFLNILTHKYRTSTINKIYDQIKQGFTYAYKYKYIFENPMQDVIKPKSRLQNLDLRAFTIEEQQKFSDYLFNSTLEQEKYKNVFLLQLYLGLRVSEALALKKEDIDLKNKVIKINKTLTIDKNGNRIMGDTTKTYAGKRILPIPDFIFPIVEEQVEVSKQNPEHLLFTYDNHYVHNHSINTQFKRILKNLGIQQEGLSTHSCRHSYATRCIEAGMPAVVLQKLMGHTDIKVTLNTYTSVFNRFKQDEIDKVNDYYKNNNLYHYHENKKDIKKIDNDFER